MHPIDIVIVFAYLIGIMVVGIAAGYRKNISSEQFFLAGKSLGWFSIGAALFAANISTIHLVGLAASGADTGIVVGNFEWMASFCLIILGLVFAPFYFQSRISTLPEFLERRYSPTIRTFLACIGILGALLIHIGISLFAGAKLFENFLGMNVYWSILIISGVTVIYTVLGGLKGVVVTETIQTFLLLGGAVLVTILGILYLPKIGIENFSQFKDQLKPDQMSMIHPIKNSQGHLNPYSWLAVLLGYPVLGIWYWCSDQTIVQRVLGAHKKADAQNGALFAGFLKILPLFLMVFPGVIGYLIYKNGHLTLTTLPNGKLDFNSTLPAMINLLIPKGLKGLMAAGFLAALMSTISAALNSCATLISVDVVKRIRPDISDSKQVNIGKFSTAVIMVLAMLWSTQGEQFGTIFEAINKIPMIFAPAVTCVFLLGVFWRRGTKQAALATFAVGCLLGFVYFILDMPVVGRLFLENPSPDFAGLVTDAAAGVGIPFMIMGPILFVVCLIVYIAVSLSTPAPSAEQLKDVCWEHPLQAFTEGKITGASDPRVIAGILLVTMCILYYLLR